MRPIYILFTFLTLFILIDGMLYLHAGRRAKVIKQDQALQSIVVARLGLTDLAVATEARYTRNPSVSDPIAPFMDHPGAIEHFPTGTFWTVPQNFYLQ